MILCSETMFSYKDHMLFLNHNRLFQFVLNIRHLVYLFTEKKNIILLVSVWRKLCTEVEKQDPISSISESHLRNKATTIMLRACTSCIPQRFHTPPQTFKMSVLPFRKMISGLHIPKTFQNIFSEIFEIIFLKWNFQKMIFGMYEMRSSKDFSEWDFQKIFKKLEQVFFFSLL